MIVDVVVLNIFDTDNDSEMIQMWLGGVSEFKTRLSGSGNGGFSYYTNIISKL